jgi:hypothetical protein
VEEAAGRFGERGGNLLEKNANQKADERRDEAQDDLALVDGPGLLQPTALRRSRRQRRGLDDEDGRGGGRRGWVRGRGGRDRRRGGSRGNRRGRRRLRLNRDACRRQPAEDQEHIVWFSSAPRPARYDRRPGHLCRAPAE